MKLTFGTLSLAVFLALAPAALASTTWYVDGVNGSNSNNCRSPSTACKTIAHAISLASSGDTISVAAATYTENITIGISLNLIGSGARTTVIDGGGRHTVVTISSRDAHVSLSRVTLQNGGGRIAGGVSNIGMLTISHSTIQGNNVKIAGGIFNNGTLTIDNSTIKRNVLHRCGFRCVGAGILNQGGVLTIDKSTISGNSGKWAGGIYNDVGSRLTLNNSTIANNHGAGIYNGAAMTINNSTISGNRSTMQEGIFNCSNCAATLQNTIVANNSNRNCVNTITSNGYNLSSDGTCNFNSTGDLNGTDPMLGSLQNNGGPTQTEALQSGSPAIDAGNPSGCTDGSGHLLKTDQRGMPRPDKEDSGGCDMGAYELQTE